MAKDGVVYTPAPNGTFLNGITRQRVIELLRGEGVTVVEATLRYADFLAADEILFEWQFRQGRARDPDRRPPACTRTILRACAEAVLGFCACGQACGLMVMTLQRGLCRMAFRTADLIVDSLVAHGVDRAFSVPGESFLALLDALSERNEIDLVTCRHEGSASLAAVADAKLTGRAGVVITSRGPGACNAALGLHVASQEAKRPTWSAKPSGGGTSPGRAGVAISTFALP